MPTSAFRDGYDAGYLNGFRAGVAQAKAPKGTGDPFLETLGFDLEPKAFPVRSGKKRKLSAWNKFVKANSKKPRFRYRNGKLNLKKMAIAFRKTPAGKKKRR
jgi:hypothetical protein